MINVYCSVRHKTDPKNASRRTTAWCNDDDDDYDDDDWPEVHWKLMASKRGCGGNANVLLAVRRRKKNKSDAISKIDKCHMVYRLSTNETHFS